jgi:hypothetical protein
MVRSQWAGGIVANGVLVFWQQASKQEAHKLTTSLSKQQQQQQWLNIPPLDLRCVDRVV